MRAWCWNRVSLTGNFDWRLHVWGCEAHRGLGRLCLSLEGSCLILCPNPGEQPACRCFQAKGIH